MKNLGFVILILLANNAFAQNTISATYSSDIPTNYSTFSFNYNCNLGYLSISLPAGQTYNVTSVDVTYSMTALNGGYQSDQFSSIRFLNNDTREATEAQNNIASAGTYLYNRSINIANGNFNGGTALVFELSARRSWSGSIFNCGTDVNKVNANSWTITVHYSNQVPYSYVGIGTTTASIAKLEVAGVATGSSSGTTSAALGSDGAGISLQRNWPAIGFNQYRDNNLGFGKYMKNGAAAVFALDPGTGNMALDMYGIGLKNAALSIGYRAISISRLSFGYGSIGFGGNNDPFKLLTINKNTFNTNATAVIAGTDYSSFFCNGTNEDTYIRGGLNNSKVFINDLSGDNQFGGNVKIIGKLSIGLGASQNPVASTEIYGGLAITKHPLIDVSSQSSSNTIPVYNSSFIEVTTSLFNPGVYLTEGDSQGQMLILKVVNRMRINYSPRTYIQAEAGDTILFIGDKIITGIDFPGYYWKVLSVSHNN